MHFLKTLVGLSILLLSAPFAAGQTTHPTTQPTTMPIRLMGTVVSVDEDQLVVARRPTPGNEHPDSDQVTIPLGPNGVVRIDGEKSAVSDLRPGMMVQVQSVPGNAHRPERLYVIASSQGLFGAIARVDGANIVVKPPGDDSKEITVVTDDKTKVSFLGAMINGKNIKPAVGKVSDLKPGMRIKIVPATGTAKRILVMPNLNQISAASKPSE